MLDQSHLMFLVARSRASWIPAFAGMTRMVEQSAASNSIPPLDGEAVALASFERREGRQHRMASAAGGVSTPASENPPTRPALPVDLPTRGRYEDLRKESGDGRANPGA